MDNISHVKIKVQRIVQKKSKPIVQKCPDKFWTISWTKCPNFRENFVKFSEMDKINPIFGLFCPIKVQLKKKFSENFQKTKNLKKKNFFYLNIFLSNFYRNLSNFCLKILIRRKKIFQKFDQS